MNGRTAGSLLKRGQFPVRDGMPANTITSSLILSTKVHDSITQRLGRCLPREGLGVLATRGAGSSLTAVYVYPGRNVDSSPRRYTMDSADVLPALVAMEREKTRLGAIVHSHPNTSPSASRTDLVVAKPPGVLSVIVGFSPRVDLRAWSLDYDGHGVTVRFDEVPAVRQDTSERARLGFLKRSGHNREMRRGPVKGST
jgi:proteasome lid subunit RPN8/RPN11